MNSSDPASFNPFLPFSLATGGRFINRDAELQAVINRLTLGGHSAIVGNPHVGKSSLLKRLAELLRAGKILPVDSFAVVEMDFGGYGPSAERGDFWREVARQASDENPAVAAPLRPFADLPSPDPQALRRAFAQIGERGGRVILLLDEFDLLFNLQAFGTLDFLGPVRMNAEKTEGLTLMIASRESLADLNQKTAAYKTVTRGSALLNFLEEIRLGALPPKPAMAWLDQHLNPEARDEALRLAGHHPLLLHLAGELLYPRNADPPATYRDIYPLFLQKAEQQFRDVWDYLGDRAQIALVIFALRVLQGKAGGQTFNLEGVERTLSWYQAEVKEMALRGTLETAAGGQYTFGSTAFHAWLVEQKIAGTRGDEPQEAFTKWLRDKQFKLGGLITVEEINVLKKMWAAIPAGLVDLAKKALLPKALQ